MNEEELNKRLKWYEDNYGPYIEKRGFHKQNFLNLFRKPRLNDWIIFILVVLTLLTALGSWSDLTTCHNTLNNLKEICAQYSSPITNHNESISNFNELLTLTNSPFAKGIFKEEMNNTGE